MPHHGSCHSARCLRFAGHGAVDPLRSQTISSFCSVFMNSSSFATQPSYLLSSSIADLIGQALPYGNCIEGSFHVDSCSCSGFELASPRGNMDKNNVAGCSSSVSYHSSSEFLDSAEVDSPCNLYSNQVDKKALVLSKGQHIISGALNKSGSEIMSHSQGLYCGASFDHQNTMSAWPGPEILSLNQKFANVQEQKILLEKPNHYDCMTDSMLEACGVFRCGVHDRCNILPDAHLQVPAGDGKTQVNEKYAENVHITINDKHTGDGATHMYRLPPKHHFCIAPNLNMNNGQQVNTTTIVQLHEFDSGASYASYNGLEGHVHNDAYGESEKLDNSRRLASKEFGNDCDQSLMVSDSCSYWNVLGTQSDGRVVSSISHHMKMDIDSCGPFHYHEKLFTILDISPDWTYSGMETKILISGTFQDDIDPSSIKWYCIFGDQEVSAELVPISTICCQAPMHIPGRVLFYITCGDRRPCSEAWEFEFRANLFNATLSISLKGETEDEISLQRRFAKMLSCGIDKKRPVCSDNDCHKCKLNNYFVSNDDESERIGIEKNSNHWNDALNQKLLKDKLSEWLLCKTHEGGRGPNVLDEEGQGIIHLAAALGYDWAMSPIVAAGVSPSFRDSQGRTGLHWAAYFGRLETVRALVRLGASPGAVEDPTSEFPNGQTAANLATSRGYKGIAGFLAEVELASHSSLTLKEDTPDSHPEDIVAEMEVEAVPELNTIPPTGDRGQELSLRASLAAFKEFNSSCWSS